MSLTRTIASTTFCISAVLGMTSAFSEGSAASKKEKIAENQIIKDIPGQSEALRAEQKNQPVLDTKKNYVQSSKCPDEKCEYRTAAVGFGPYFKKDNDYAGGNLIGNLPSTRTDEALLTRAYNEQKEAKELGAPAPFYPRVTLGSHMEVAGLYNHSAKSPGSFELAPIDVMAYFQVSPWISGYMDVTYDTSDINKNGQLGLKFSLFSGFVTIGNLSQSPFFFTIGKMRAPFGRHTSNFAENAPVTFSARNRVKMAEIGFKQVGDNAFHAEAYTYQGLARIDGKANPYHWGAAAGYNFKANDTVSGEVGGSYISNFTDSDTVQKVFASDVAMKAISDPKNPPVSTGDFNWQEAVPAANAWTVLSVGPLAFRGEYTQTVEDFDSHDIKYEGKAARPKLLYLEGAYNFKTGSKSSAVGMGYEHTWQAVAFSLPQTRYTVFYNVVPLRHTLLTLEYSHGIHYPNSLSDKTTTMPDSVKNNLDNSDNIADVVFDVYF